MTKEVIFAVCVVIVLVVLWYYFYYKKDEGVKEGLTQMIVTRLDFVQAFYQVAKKYSFPFSQPFYGTLDNSFALRTLGVVPMPSLPFQYRHYTVHTNMITLPALSLIPENVYVQIAVPTQFIGSGSYKLSSITIPKIPIIYPVGSFWTLLNPIVKGMYSSGPFTTNSNPVNLSLPKEPTTKTLGLTA